MATMSLIAQNALAAIDSFLADNGSDLIGDHRKAIRGLLDALGQGLEGKLDPVFYLASIDPGVGKTLTVAKFLQALIAADNQAEASVLVGVSRLEEITSYLRHSGLRQEQIAVLTSDEQANGLGVAPDLHGSAVVMFTTQQMIESRTRGRRFADATEFHCNGRPRLLRIWDESIMPAKPVVIRLYDVAGLMAPLSARHAALAKVVEQIVAMAYSCEPGQSLTVPEALAEVREPRGALLTDGEKAALSGLRLLAGQEAVKLPAGGGEMRLVGVAPSIPSDFAPAIVLDASGRVRETYRLWDAGRGTLRWLPAAVNDYAALAVHIWQRASGRTELANPTSRAAVAEAIADVIKQSSGNRWLIVHYKARGDLFADVVRQVDDPGKDLSNVTWGMHHGTNAYADFENVVIVGAYHYSEAAYPAYVAAAGGRSVSETTPEEVEAVQWGEFQHNLLQAVCRSSVRRSRNGKASHARAFLVTQPSRKVTARIEQTFPGCRVFEWKPVEKLEGRLQAAADFLLRTLAAEPRVSKRALQEHLGMASAANFSRDILKNGKFTDFLGRNHIDATHHAFESYAPSFEPYPRGGWVADEPENEEAASDACNGLDSGAPM